MRPRAAGKQLPGRKYDRYFFSSLVFVILVSVAIGFAHSYYLAGVFTAPLPSLIIHVHGVVLTAWIVMLCLQTGLVSARQVKLHRTLGLAGFGLAALVVVFGVLASADQLRFRAHTPGRDILAFSAISFTDIFAFAVLAGLAYATRTSSTTAHKRLVVIATIALTNAAFDRWPVPFLYRNVPHANMVSNVLLLLMVAYDLWSTQKVHRTTLWGSVFLVFMQQMAMPIGSTAVWHWFAGWLQSLQI